MTFVQDLNQSRWFAWLNNNINVMKISLIMKEVDINY